MQRGLIIAVIVIALVVGAAGALYAFGTPQAQGPSSQGSEPVVVSAEGEVPPADPSSPLHIEIPGCVCHSDDPKIVEEHAEYRMNQCAGCHKDGVPTGQELTQ